MTLIVMLFYFFFQNWQNVVGALLYKMEAAVRLGYTSSARTDLAC